MSLYHPVVSPSPVAKAFCYVVRAESLVAASQFNYNYSASGEDSGSVPNGRGRMDGRRCDILNEGGGEQHRHSVRSEYATEEEEGQNAENHNSNGRGMYAGVRRLDEEDFVPPYYLSRPETALLHTADDNPLEYTLAAHQEAVAYVRLLLKLLQQVVTANTDDDAGRHTCKDLPLDTPPFRTQDDAFAFYYNTSHQQNTHHHKRLVVAHYVITKVYEIIGILLYYERKHRRTKTKKTTTTTKTRENNNRRGSGTSSSTGRIGTISEIFVGTGNQQDVIQADEWKVLVQLLETRAVDDYTKRGAALIVAYIVKCECDYEQAASSSSSSPRQPQPQETLVSPLQSIKKEHKSTTVPSSLLLLEPWLNLHSNNNNNMHNTNNPRVVVEDTIRRVLSWLTERLQSSVGHDQATYASSLGVVTPCLSVLLSTCPTARTLFLSESGGGGIGYLVRHIKHLIRRMQQQQQQQQQRSRRITPTPTIPIIIANTSQQQFHGTTMKNSRGTFVPQQQQHYRPIDDNTDRDRGGSYSTSSSSSALASFPEHISATTTAASSSRIVAGSVVDWTNDNNVASATRTTFSRGAVVLNNRTSVGMAPSRKKDRRIINVVVLLSLSFFSFDVEVSGEVLLQSNDKHHMVKINS